MHLTNEKLHLTKNNWDVEPYLTNETCDLTDTNCHLITQNWDLTNESLDSAGQPGEIDQPNWRKPQLPAVDIKWIVDPRTIHVHTCTQFCFGFMVHPSLQGFAQLTIYCSSMYLR